MLFPPQVSGKKVAGIENSFYLCTVKTKTKLDRPEKQGVSNLNLKIKLTNQEAMLP